MASPISVPVLFLDFDGVLHPDAVYREKGRIVLRRTEVTLFEWAPMLAFALESHPEVRIVLSTSWVRVLSYDRARARLPSSLQTRVIGATYHSQMRRWGEEAHRWSDPFLTMTRYQQILGYVMRHQVKSWLAVDDDTESWNPAHTENLVATDSEQGISAPDTHAELVLKLSRLGAGNR
jgi:hypothetical protein